MINWNSKKISAVLALGISLALNFSMALPTVNAAKPPDIIPGGSEQLKIPHDATNSTPQAFITERILPGATALIINITGGLALVFTVLSGIMLINTYGSASTAESAKKMLSFALIGVIISGLSYAIVKIIASINPGS